MKDTIFEIIELTAGNKHYFPNSMKRQSWMDDHWVKANDMEISLGQSRYGGCIIDLPKGIEIPKGMRFAGQLDLKTVSQFDTQNRLPKTGQLLFFTDLMTDTGKVIYSNVANNELERIIEEHQDHFFSGILITEFKANQEKISDYYTIPEGELECWECGENILKCDCEYEGKKEHIESLDLNDEGKSWGYFEGYSKSKLFGVYANCQSTADERLEVMDDYIVLLQIGENNFNDEGVFNILITEQDLKKQNFDNCKLEWVQS